MIENKLSFFFKNQIWHIGGLVVLFYAGLQMVDFNISSILINMTMMFFLLRKIPITPIEKITAPRVK